MDADRRGALCPGHRRSLDEQAAKRASGGRFKALGPWWAELPPYLRRVATPPVAAFAVLAVALAAYYAWHGDLVVSRSGGTSRSSSLCLIPSVFRARLLRRLSHGASALVPLALALLVLVVPRARGAGVALELAKLAR